MSEVPALLPSTADRAERIKVYKRRWNARNAERQVDEVRKWRQKNPDRVQAWRDTDAKQRRDDGLLPASTVRGRYNRREAMFNSAKYRAKRKGLSFAITKDDIVIPEFCPVFGIRLETSPDVGRSDASPSLDRINNSKGYVKDNVIVVSWLANRIKSDATVEQLRIVANFYGSCQTSSPNLRR